MGENLTFFSKSFHENFEGAVGLSDVNVKLTLRELISDVSYFI